MTSESLLWVCAGTGEMSTLSTEARDRLAMGATSAAFCAVVASAFWYFLGAIIFR